MCGKIKLSCHATFGVNVVAGMVDVYEPDG